MIKVLELFAGIGACSKALERLKIEHKIIDAVEIDKYAIKSFNAIHRTDFQVQDIRNWDKEIEVDLIMHGSPCQDFSSAGKQAGGDIGSGTRSSLMYETLRIVDKLKPTYVIWENVKNILSKKHIHNFNNYLKLMAEMGYKNYYQVLNAKDYGIPQNRERVFTISILDNKIFNFPEKQELKLRLKDILEEKVDEKYYLTKDKIHKISNWKAYSKPFERVMGKESIVPTITARGAGEEHSGMITYCAELEDTSNLQEQCLRIKEKDNLKEQLCNSLIKDKLVKENDVIRHSYSTSRMKKFYVQNRKNNNICPTLDTRCDCLGACINENEYLRIRKLTPKECFRLMGFDDSDYEKVSQINSNAQLYKQAGNSIVVNVMEAIFINLFKNK